MGLLGTNGLAPQGQMNLYRLICDMAKKYPPGENGRNFIRNHKSCRRILGETKHCQRRPLWCKGIRLVSQKGNQFTIRLENISLDEIV